MSIWCILYFQAWLLCSNWAIIITNSCTIVLPSQLSFHIPDSCSPGWTGSWDSFLTSRFVTTNKFLTQLEAGSSFVVLRNSHLVSYFLFRTTQLDVIIPNQNLRHWNVILRFKIAEHDSHSFIHCKGSSFLITEILPQVLEQYWYSGNWDRFSSTLISINELESATSLVSSKRRFDLPIQSGLRMSCHLLGVHAYQSFQSDPQFFGNKIHLIETISSARLQPPQPLFFTRSAPPMRYP